MQLLKIENNFESFCSMHLCFMHISRIYLRFVYCRPKEKMIDCVHKQRDTIRYILFLKFDYDHRRNAEISLKCKNL